MSKLGFFALLLYVLVVLLRPQDYQTLVFEMPIIFILEMVMLVSWFLTRKRFDAPQYLLLFFLYITVVISRVLYGGVSLGLEAAQDFFLTQVLTFVLMANILTTADRQRAFLNAFVLGTMVMALHSIDQSLDPNKIGWTGEQAVLRNDGPEPLWQTRYIGIFEDPNDLGMVLSCAIPFILYLYRSAANFFMRAVQFVNFALHIYAIYLTNSRGTMLSVAVMFGVWILLRYGGIKMLMQALIISAIIPSVLPTRMFISGDESSQDRIDAWYEGTLMLKDNPVFGVGYNAFLEYHYKTAHNSWVLAFAEMGLVGYYCWTALMFTSLYMVWVCQKDFKETVLSASHMAAYNKEKALAGAVMFAMIGAFSCAFFLSRTYSVVLFMLAALAVSQFHRYKDNFPTVAFKPMAKRMVWISLGILVAINLTIRVNTV